jgi:hypothetical protein
MRDARGETGNLCVVESGRQENYALLPNGARMRILPLVGRPRGEGGETAVPLSC